MMRGLHGIALRTRSRNGIAAIECGSIITLNREDHSVWKGRSHTVSRGSRIQRTRIEFSEIDLPARKFAVVPRDPRLLDISTTVELRVVIAAHLFYIWQNCRAKGPVRG
jgi:hypothetical protein